LPPPSREGGKFVLLIATSGNRQTIAHCCERSAAAGVVKDMSLAHARALLPLNDVLVQECSPQHDEQRLRALASWAIRFSPIVAPDPPDGLLLDVTGCQRVHRGERRLVNAIANSIEWLGFRARVACASTFACAWAVARYGGQSPSPSADGDHSTFSNQPRERAGVRVQAGDEITLTPTLSLSRSSRFERSSPAEREGACAHADRFVVPAGNELDALRDLPIEALRLEQDTIDALHEVNIDRIGHLARLPRNDLAARFGRGLLLRMDQALGDAEETLEPMRPIVLLRVERAFDGPVKQIEGILLATQELVGELCERLREKESGARRLDLEFERIDAANLREPIMLSRPSRDARHLWTLLRLEVEQINLGFGVEKIALTAMRTGRLPHAQAERWREGAGDDAQGLERAAGELIDTLASRLGAERIVRVKPVESHVPERAFRHESVMGEQQSTVSGQPSAGVKRVDRPTVLFDKPESIDVLAVTPEGPPSWLRWRGEEHTIIASSGPERIAEEWWHCLAAGLAPRCDSMSLCAVLARDYFRIQINDGRWLWVFRQLESGRWFVHGEWA
jgi:protein ImuB